MATGQPEKYTPTALGNRILSLGISRESDEGAID
jgi:hypothetical protein